MTECPHRQQGCEILQPSERRSFCGQHCPRRGETIRGHPPLQWHSPCLYARIHLLTLALLVTSSHAAPFNVPQPTRKQGGWGGTWDPLPHLNWKGPSSLTCGNDQWVHTNLGSFWKYTHQPVFLSRCVLQTYGGRNDKKPFPVAQAHCPTQKDAIHQYHDSGIITKHLL